MERVKAADPPTTGRRTSAPAHTARDSQCHLLCGSQWVFLADDAQRLSALEDGLPLLAMLEVRWNLGEDAPSIARENKAAGATKPHTQCSDFGQPVGTHQCKRGVRGYDGGKKISGRKRQILVDTLGLVMKVLVHPANVHDRKGGLQLLQLIQGQFPELIKIWADQGYTSSDLGRWAKEVLQVDFEVVYPWWRQLKRYFPEIYKEAVKGFQVIRKRWIVERTFAWLTFQRRLVKDYELLPQTSENLVYVAMIRIMLRRLAT